MERNEDMNEIENRTTAVRMSLEDCQRQFQSFGRQAMASIIQMGRIVSDVYFLCDEAGIGAVEWIVENLGVSPNAARNYRRMWDNRELLAGADLPPSAAYRLLAPSVPESVVTSVLERARQGAVTVEEVEAEIDKARLLGTVIVIGQGLNAQFGGNAQKMGSALKSMSEVAQEAQERGVVEVEGMDHAFSDLFEEAVQERTERRRVAHVESQYAVNETLTGYVVTDGDTEYSPTWFIQLIDPPASILQREGNRPVTVLWRERKADHV